MKCRACEERRRKMIAAAIKVKNSILKRKGRNNAKSNVTN